MLYSETPLQDVISAGAGCSVQSQGSPSPNAVFCITKDARIWAWGNNVGGILGMGRL